MTSVLAAMLLAATPVSASDVEAPLGKGTVGHRESGFSEAPGWLFVVGAPAASVGLGICSWVGREHVAGLGGLRDRSRECGPGSPLPEPDLGGSHSRPRV